jgi:glutamyl-tRNA synthetase
MSNDEIRKAAIKSAAYNASQHEGKAQVGSVVGRVLAEHPRLKPRVKEIMTYIHESIKEVNSWTQEEQQQYIEEHFPELLERKKVEEKKTLPPLENVDKYKIVKTRFAPNPDGSLHLGSAEPIIFCDEYAKMYNGHFILRYEDTSSDIKPPIIEMYDWILDDLEWLGVEVHEIYRQSDRIEIYYEYAEKLLRKGKAYICVCKQDDFKELYMNSKPCSCRTMSPEDQLDRWGKMLDGTYKRGEAVVRIKTDLDHPNPAVRDWPALRISEAEHPLQGNKYRVWPLYNFSCGLDDHLMGVTHVIRGKEHDVNTIRQRYLQEHFGWSFPEVINVGRLGLEVGVLSKSKIRAGVDDGTYCGWDDPRLGTLVALRRRGLKPETIREIMIHVGPKPVNVTISWDNIAAANRKIIEPESNRFYFIQDPLKLEISGIPELLVAELPLHPDYPKRGFRKYCIDPKNGEFTFNVSVTDKEKLQPGKLVRLMGLMNIEIIDYSDELVKGKYHSMEYKEAREKQAPFIQWLPENSGVDGVLVMPDATKVCGLVEEACLNLNVDDSIQFERVGFVRIDSVKPFITYFTHK